MILFVPAYDPQTHANLAIAAQLAPEGPGALRLLLGAEASRAALAEALTSGEAPVFAMSHGQQGRLLAQGGEPALDEEDEELLGSVGRRAVFAYACHTATRLGRAAAAHGATWWGYTGKLQAPVHEPPFGAMFSALFQLIMDRFWSAASPLDRDVFLAELRRRCHAVATAIDDLGDAHPDADTFSAQLCALHVWDRLRIWVTGAEWPEQHPDARPPALMLD